MPNKYSQCTLLAATARLLVTSLMFVSGSVFAQVTELPPISKGAPVRDEKKSMNLSTEQSKKPLSKKHGVSESAQVNDAERKANLKTCIDGRYPSLCKHSKLTQSERSQVDVAEKRANFKTCIDGRYPSLCKHSSLTPSERDQVIAAEKQANLKVCLDGRYPSLCNHALLNKSDIKQVSNAEKRSVK